MEDNNEKKEKRIYTFYDEDYNIKDVRKKEHSRFEPHWLVMCVAEQHERKLVDMINRTKPIKITRMGKEVVKYPNPMAMSLRAKIASLHKFAFRLRAFVPLKTELRRWSDRIKKVRVVQTPGLVFVYISEHFRSELFKIDPDHIRWFLCCRGVPSVIPKEDMRIFIKCVKHGLPTEVVAAEKYEPGEKVRVTEGPLKGRVFNVLRVDEANDEGEQNVVLQHSLGNALLSQVNVSSAIIVKVADDAVDEVDEFEEDEEELLESLE